jgi:hypothetical protein
VLEKQRHRRNEDRNSGGEIHETSQTRFRPHCARTPGSEGDQGDGVHPREAVNVEKLKKCCTLILVKLSLQ